MTPWVWMDLEAKLQTGPMSHYARMRFRIRAGCPRFVGSRVDQEGQSTEWLLRPAEATLREVCETAGQTFQIRVDELRVHPVDTRIDTVGWLTRGAVRLATRYDLGGDRDWGVSWSPPRWFRVICVRPMGVV